MSRDATLSAINCTACGAGLDILGGGRVTTHICPYCGTELDALHGYQTLRKFSQAARPETPFTIGMTGRLMGVDWTIIGLLQHRETYGGQSWTWIDHQLFSPTHGYAWLTLEDGHVTFARRVRGLAQSTWMSERWVETAETPPTLALGSDRFKYYETATSAITYAEGEFTYSPARGQKTTTISAVSGSAMLDFAETGTEREIHRVTWLDPVEAAATFDLPKGALRPRGIHPAQPYRGWKEKPALRNLSLGFAALCFVIGLLLSGLPGRPVLDPVTVDLAQLPQTISFDITDATRRLAGLYFQADVSNSWAFVELALSDPQGAVLFEAGRMMEFYFGRDSDGQWTEGDRRAALHFLPTVPGTYALTLSGVEQGVWGSGGQDARQVTVSARSGMSSGRYLFGLMLGFLMLAAALSVGRVIHHMRRWRHTDWSDE